jgi:hypothetical protein
MTDRERHNSIWLEVSNVRLENKSLQVQVKGDKADREPVWWKVDLKEAGYGEGVGTTEEKKPDPNAAYRTISEGLDKKKIVLARLMFIEKKSKTKETSKTDEISNTEESPKIKGTLKCTSIRVQYSESNSR